MLVRLKDDLDRYHKRYLKAHGHLYVVTTPDETHRNPYVHDDSVVRRANSYEAKSIATGAICLLSKDYVEESNGEIDTAA